MERVTYRATRSRPYGQGTPGYRNVEARQGYYIEASDATEALQIMQSQFPFDESAMDSEREYTGDTRPAFTVQYWNKHS